MVISFYEVNAMRSTIVFLSLLFSFSFAKAQPKDCSNCMKWSENRKLNWADFQGKPKKSSPNEALTDSGMSIELECDDKNSRAVVTCYFNPNKSWTKSKESEYLLAHEQLHFDITELFVRKLRKKLSELGNDCQALSKHIEDYYQSNYKDFVAYQDRYDRETKHSLNKEKQQYWNEKVARELKELKRFDSSTSD